jgi:hypothetical protein
MVRAAASFRTAQRQRVFSPHNARCRYELCITARRAGRAANVAGNFFAFVKNLEGRSAGFASVFINRHGVSPLYIVEDVDFVLGRLDFQVGWIEIIGDRDERAVGQLKSKNLSIVPFGGIPAKLVEICKER